jgi:hypothetical protein
VLNWVRKRTRAGLGTKEIVELTRTAEDWPRPGSPLSDGTLASCRCAIYHLEDQGVRWPLQPGGTKPLTKESGKRLRQLHSQKRNGRPLNDLWYLQKAVAEHVGVLEGFDLPELDWSEEAQDLILEIHDDLMRAAVWTDSSQEAVVAQMSDLSRLRTLQKLRIRADDPSSAPSERRMAARAADKLKQKHALGG